MMKPTTSVTSVINFSKKNLVLISFLPSHFYLFYNLHVTFMYVFFCLISLLYLLIFVYDLHICTDHRSSNQQRKQSFNEHDHSRNIIDAHINGHVGFNPSSTPIQDHSDSQLIYTSLPSKRLKKKHYLLLPYPFFP